MLRYRGFSIGKLAKADFGWIGRLPGTLNRTLDHMVSNELHAVADSISRQVAREGSAETNAVCFAQSGSVLAGDILSPQPRELTA